MDRGWFRKVPGTSGRYRATCWQGLAGIAATVIAILALPFGLARLWAVAGIVALPIWMPTVLALSFRLIARNSASG